VVVLAIVGSLAKFKECNFIDSRNIDEGLKFLKGSHDPQHAPFDPLAKFKQCSFIHSRNIEGGLKYLKGSSDPDHALS